MQIREVFCGVKWNALACGTANASTVSITAAAIDGIRSATRERLSVSRVRAATPAAGLVRVPATGTGIPPGIHFIHNTTEKAGAGKDFGITLIGQYATFIIQKIFL